jgi:hypothetical protein
VTTLLLFRAYTQAAKQAERALEGRGLQGKGRWGIGVDSDYHARNWQAADRHVRILGNRLRRRLGADEPLACLRCGWGVLTDACACEHPAE